MSTCNTSTNEFLDAFRGGETAFVAIWPNKGSLAGQKHPLVEVGYGLHADFTDLLQELNAQGYGIYFTANDPKANNHLHASVSELRCIAQDCDKPGFAHFEPVIAAVEAHFVWETSPGRMQRVWFTDPLPREWHKTIMQKMCELHHHDKNACRFANLFRLPGYKNTKYDGFPEVRIVADRRIENADLTFAEVKVAFLGKVDPTMYGTTNALTKIQGSNGKDVSETREEKVKLAEIIEILCAIDPDSFERDVARYEKVSIIAALHWMAEGEPWGEAVAEHWAAFSAFYKPAEFNKLWKGLKADHLNPSHLRTLERKVAKLRDDALIEREIDLFEFNQQSRELSFAGLITEFGPFVDIRVLRSLDKEEHELAFGKQTLQIVFPFKSATGKASATNIHNVIEVFKTYNKTLKFNEFTRRAEVDGVPIDDNEIIGAVGLCHRHNLDTSPTTVKNAAYYLVLLCQKVSR